MLRKTFFLFLFLLSVVCSFAGKPKEHLSFHQLEFIANKGQWLGDFSYRASLRGGAIFFDESGYVVSMIDPKDLHRIHDAKDNGDDHADFSATVSSYKVSFLNRNPSSSYISYGEKSSYYFNYFLGASHYSGIYAYPALVRYSIYEGIDLFTYQSGDHIKYEFHVTPHADPSNILMLYTGANSLSISSDCLIIDNKTFRVVELPPFAYQLSTDHDTIPINCKYYLHDNVVSFVLGDYDRNKELVIDPVVVFSSFSGSTADNWGYTATYDANGNLYGGGISFGTGYPTTFGAFQADFCSGSGSLLTDVSISKFDSSGAFLRYSTYLGGSYVDIPHSLFVNENDELYVFGTTGSPNFPITPNAFDTSFNYGSNVTLSTSLKFPLGSDIFVSKFSADGRHLLASTFVGGSENDGINTAAGLRKNYADDNRGEILVDLNSNVYVITSTYSTDFPVTANAYDTVNAGGQDVCIFKMSQDLSQMVWCTYLGGSSNDAGYSMALTDAGDVYVCGGTASSDFPVSVNALQTSLAGDVDGFVAHLSANGDQLIHGSYLGQSGYDQAYLIKNDRNFVPYVFGQTDAPGNAWIKNASYNMPGGGQFLMKMSPSLDSIVWSTAFGTGNGGPDISPTALSVDYCNNIYMSGWGSFALNGFGGTAGLPITLDAFQSTTDGSDYYFICLSDDAAQLVYGSFFGGAASSAREHVDGGTSRFDRKGCIYQAVCAGCGGQSTFPTTPGAWSTTNGSSNCNLGVIKMDFGMPVVVADFRMPNSICIPGSVHFDNYSQTIGNSTSYYWDFGDGSHSYTANPNHSYAHSGYYQVTLIVQDNGSCNFSDTLSKHILVLSNSSDTLSAKRICYGDFIQIGLPPSNEVNYLWSPAATLSNATISNPNASPEQTTWYSLIASSDGCRDTIYQKVEVDTLSVALTPDTTICMGDPVTLSLFTDSQYNSILWSATPDFSSLILQNQPSVTVHPDATTTYYVRVVGDVCQFEGAITVTVSNVQIAPIDTILICFEDGVELSVAHTCGAGCQFLWIFEDGTTYTEEHPYVNPSASSSYSVTVTNPFGCSATETGYIIKRAGTFPSPFSAWCNECEIIQAHSTTVYATDYGEGYTYQWTPVEDMQTPTQAQSVVSPLETTLYAVQITDSYGCTQSDTVRIIVHELTCDDPFIFIPNAFSPNGDGLNDILYVQSDILQEFSLVIYSRWGEKIFETTSLESGWDGTYKNKQCQNGIYDYYFSGTCVGGKTCVLKGNVMLVR